MAFRRLRVTVAIALALLAIFCVPLAAPAGQTTMGEVKEETAEAAETIRNYTAEQRDEAVGEAKAALKDLDQRIDRLEAQVRSNWNRMDQAARDKSTAALRSLRREREEVAEWYGDLQHGSAETWNKVKRGFSEAYERLKASWQATEKELGPEK